eukprot:710756-Amphidinium_carterae.1
MAGVDWRKKGNQTVDRLHGACVIPLSCQLDSVSLSLIGAIGTPPSFPSEGSLASPQAARPMGRRLSGTKAPAE